MAGPIVWFRRTVRRIFFPNHPMDVWCRLEMHRDIRTFLTALGPERLDALEVSGFDYQDLPWQRFDTLLYPAFDLCDPTPVDRTYDVVLCEQVLEHVRDPWRAVKTLHSLCRPGGLVVANTPFLIRIHEYPGDYWRFTPDGMRVLLEGAGFGDIETRSWGNRRCVNANFKKWAPYRPWSSLKNEPDFPLVVWAFGRRPAES